MRRELNQSSKDTDSLLQDGQARKKATGKPRPDIIARCLPDFYGQDIATQEMMAKLKQPFMGLVTSAICDQKNHHILKDGFKSWPSGHSSSGSPLWMQTD